MRKYNTDVQIGTLTVASEKINPRQWLKKVTRDFKIGGEISPFSPEIQEDLRTRLTTCELRLNQLFATAIHFGRKNVAMTTKFLDTQEFFSEAILQGKEVPRDLIKLIELITQTMDTLGLRSFDGKTIMVHTTFYHPERDPRQATIDEAFAIGKHELVHGKIEPKLVNISPTRQERRTGSKIVILENGEIVDVKHASLYEAQTDALAVISSHPEAQSWNEIFHLYLKEQAGDSKEHGFQMAALTRLMDITFPDFCTGLTALGESYFRCDGEGFIDAISSGIKGKGNTAMQAEFDSFLQCSEKNNAFGMTQSVTRLLHLAKPII